MMKISKAINWNNTQLSQRCIDRKNSFRYGYGLSYTKVPRLSVVANRRNVNENSGQYFQGMYEVSKCQKTHCLSAYIGDYRTRTLDYFTTQDFSLYEYVHGECREGSYYDI